jgi:hypothetical protein
MDAFLSTFRGDPKFVVFENSPGILSEFVKLRPGLGNVGADTVCPAE